MSIPSLFSPWSSLKLPALGGCLIATLSVAIFAVPDAHAGNGLADLSVAVSINDHAPLVGDLIQVHVDLSNAGPQTATGISVEVSLPDGLLVDAVVDEGLGTWSEGAGLWSIASLVASSSTTLILDVVVAPAEDESAGSGAAVGDGIFVTFGETLYDMEFLPDGRFWLTTNSTIDKLVQLDASNTVLATVNLGEDSPYGVVLGPDGLLYVSLAGADRVDRFDPDLGTFVDTFVSPGSGGLDLPTSLAFENDGCLLVLSRGNGQVLRYDPDGDFSGVVVPAGSGGLSQPFGLAIGPLGDLFVTNFIAGPQKVLRYALPSGAFLGTAVDLDSDLRPYNLEFGPEGSLFINMSDSQSQLASVLRFAPRDLPEQLPALGTYVSNLSRGVGGFLFGPDGDLFGVNPLDRVVQRFRGFLTVEADVILASEPDPNPSNNRDRDAIDFRRLDFGDAPAPYPTQIADDGARHGVPPSGAWLFLGSVDPDVETDGQPDPMASGDGADEDGVTWPGDLIVGQTGEVQISVRGFGGLLDAWIDFNGDGTWSLEEQIAQSQPVPHLVTTPVEFMVPEDAVLGPHPARFRISRQGGLFVTGFAHDGEVEDHISPPVISHADLSINGTAAPDPVGAGGQLTLAISVTNDGPTTATGSKIEASNTGTQWLSTSGCAEDPTGFPTCSLGDMAAGTSVDVTYVARVDGGQIVGGGGGGEVAHSFVVSSSELDLDSANDRLTLKSKLDTRPPRIIEYRAIFGPDFSRFIDDCETLNRSFATIGAYFSEPVLDPPGNTSAVDVTNPGSWRLVSPGADGILEDSTCDALLGDDVWQQPASVEWDSSILEARLALESTLITGRHRLLACAAGLADGVGLSLDGDGNGAPGGDNAVEFRVDPDNLFRNGHFDCSLDRWDLDFASGDAEVEHGATDVDGDSGSGSAHLQGFKPGEPLNVAQCVRSPTAGILDWSMFARLDFASGGSLDLELSCLFLDETGCEGSAIATSTQIVSLEFSDWTPIVDEVVIPAGARSAYCAATTRPSPAQFYGLFLDRLNLGASPIFSDGFENGSTDAWSTSAP